MEQRQLRLGDTLDDYCPRERRLTNHAVVAMVGADVKQTRCTTCEAEHEYKHARVPKQRKKSDTPAALYAQVAASAPKRSAPPQAARPPVDDEPVEALVLDDVAIGVEESAADAQDLGEEAATIAPVDEMRLVDEDEDDADRARDEEGGPVHRRLIRASLPREGQPPASRPIPEFTIRQPTGRPGRFRGARPPQHGGGQQFQGNRSNGNGAPGGSRGNGPRQGGSRPPQGGMPSRPAGRNGPGRKRSK